MTERRATPDALALNAGRALVVVDPVCGKRIEHDQVAAEADHEGWAYFFCFPVCHRSFTTDPQIVVGLRPLEKDGESL